MMATYGSKLEGKSKIDAAALHSRTDDPRGSGAAAWNFRRSLPLAGVSPCLRLPTWRTLPAPFWSPPKQGFSRSAASRAACYRSTPTLLSDEEASVPRADRLPFEGSGENALRT